jgi:nitroimidazol reductase NimA-like FMN-containing flavoprotein (pyridoxamine 5'-phosphate oxidase superfamily)
MKNRQLVTESESSLYTAQARQVLETIQYATVATADSQGNPWNSPVLCAHDDRGRIYWSSHPDSVHSKNIQNSGKVFIVMYNSKAGEGEGLGLYIDAVAEVVVDKKEIALALELLGERRGKPFSHPEKFSDNGLQRIYRATPLKWWVNDADQDSDGDFIRDFRIEVNPLDSK